MKKLIVVVAVLLSGGFFAWNSEQIQRYVESTPPEVLVQIEEPIPVGKDPKPLEISASDNLSGVRQLSAVLLQNGKEVFRNDHSFPQAAPIQPITVDFSGSISQLEDGKAELVITVHDASLRENSTEKKLEVVVDRKSPQLLVHSLQHLGKQGGSQLVVYELRDSAPTRTGVDTGTGIFPGIPAHAVSELFGPESNVYLSLFAIPLGFDPDTQRIELFAEDIGGNRQSQSLRFQIRKYKQPESSPTLSASFLSTKIPPLLERYNRDAKQNVQSDGLSETELSEAFRIINEDYRTICDAKLRDLTSKVRPAIDWKDSFIRPVAASTSSNFGEKRTYKYEGQEMSKSVHLGFDLASVKQDKVLAVSDGVVLFAGDLGIYGNTVVIDHGLGLSSLYSHLSSSSVEAGDKVAGGQEIARTGETGLAGGDHLHFEFRLGSQSVWAVEWWDPHWLEDQFWGKLQAVAKELGGSETNDAAS